jgi:hypothetical protein
LRRPRGLPGAHAPRLAIRAGRRRATEVAIVPARIEVVGVREPQTVFTAVKQFLARKPQST